MCLCAQRLCSGAAHYANPRIEFLSWMQKQSMRAEGPEGAVVNLIGALMVGGKVRKTECQEERV